MARMTRQELLERIFHDDYEKLKELALKIYQEVQ